MIKTLKESDEILLKLKADCSKCSGLCCTALFFSKIDGFPENKAAGQPCMNLQKDFRCKIHKDLEKNKMKGCIGYDCFGAGQHVTQMVFKGDTWQDTPSKAKEIFDVFVVVFQLYQIRYFLTQALTICQLNDLAEEISELIKENEVMCNYSPKNIQQIEIESYREKINLLLRQVCSLFLERTGNENKKCPSDFLGRNFKKKDMSGLDLSTKLLIAANFEGCIFRGTLFLGADTRDTNFKDADLSEAVFLSQGQINSAKGSRNTKLPNHLEYPVTWR